MEIKITDIVIPEVRKRELNYDSVRRLASSIETIGLLHPVIVNDHNVLVSGLHRVEAYKQLGRDSIEAVTRSYDELTQELAEIDENLVRNELSVLERGEHLRRRKEIYEAQHPETKPTNEGGAFRGNQHKEVNEIISPTFTEDTAAKTNISKRTVEQEVQIARDISPEVKDKIRGTPLEDNKTGLLAISRLEKPDQEAVIEKLASDAKQRLADVVKEVKGEPVDEDEPVKITITRKTFNRLEERREGRSWDSALNDILDSHDNAVALWEKWADVTGETYSRLSRRRTHPGDSLDVVINELLEGVKHGKKK